MTTKTASVHIRMTPTEYNALQSLVNRDQLTISRLIRQLIRNEARRQGLWPVGDSDAQGSEKE